MSDAGALRTIDRAFRTGRIDSRTLSRLQRGLTLWPAVTTLEVLLLRIQLGGDA